MIPSAIGLAGNWKPICQFWISSINIVLNILNINIFSLLTCYRTRTDNEQILSLSCLPIPPSRQICNKISLGWIWTNDQTVNSRVLYHWATREFFFYFLEILLIFSSISLYISIFFLEVELLFSAVSKISFTNLS